MKMSSLYKSLLPASLIEKDVLLFATLKGYVSILVEVKGHAQVLERGLIHPVIACNERNLVKERHSAVFHFYLT